ncbi:MAG: 3-phosphoserine/phosphohydroxythreonine transaminase [Bacteroidales bacterium]|nr:3-phosphoserine/phosphohydroxythreonine transaminase [Bacteroidales bacterium]MBN2818322.1 3-phosphoserine/phosphohydroxythreonine transaminase [Bacteroidales bacterium]
MKKHNFNAGPSILSQYAIEETAKGVQNLNGSGLSVLEISHRSKDFSAIMDEATALLRELLDVPQDYSIAFIHGGASMQFCMIPYNFLNKKAAYLDTGAWSSKAIKEAKIFGEVDVVASSKEAVYNYIPKGWTIPADADYFHITTNNTIYGTEIKTDIDSPVPLIADTSSDILSRPMDVSKYGLIYGGAQKNIGPAGVGFAIIKNELLEKIVRPMPTMLSYKTYTENGSLYNTPSCVSIYSAMLNMRWLKNTGGVSAIYKKNIEKSELLYNEINRNKLFKTTVANEADRSIMNVTFVMNDEYKEKEADFMTYATSKGIIGIKGHRSVGGYRASIYNAMPIESIQVLVDAMKEYEAKL